MADGSRLTASPDVRLGRLLAGLFPRRVEALARHMREEGANLKRLVETGPP